MGWGGWWGVRVGILGLVKADNTEQKERINCTGKRVSHSLAFRSLMYLPTPCLAPPAPPRFTYSQSILPSPHFDIDHHQPLLFQAHPNSPQMLA